MIIAVRPIRDYVDTLVREFCGTQSRAAEFGYPLGNTPWRRAALEEDAKTSKKRGRPNKMNDPELIAMVEQALTQASQPSSRLSWGPQEGEWKLVRRCTH